MSSNHYAMLYALIDMFTRIAAHKRVTKMPAANIAMVFGPTLFRTIGSATGS